MKRLYILPFVFFTLFSCKHEIKDYAQYVNPFIGTGGHGHTYPGASVPFGMMQLSPDTRLTGWDGCSGYHYSDSVVYGFSHTHLSGTGVSDYGDILFMPTTGVITLKQGTPESRELGYCSLFKHENERAIPGYYKVLLEDYDIDVELTTTERSGMHKYSSNSDSLNIIVDLLHRDIVLDSYLKIIGDNEIAGYRRSQAWAQDQHLYFVAQFSEAFSNYGIAINDTIQQNKTVIEGKNVKAFFTFKNSANKPIMVRIGISAVSEDGARKNLKAEINHWDFEKIKAEAYAKWNKELNKIEVNGGTNDQLANFYTSLYHSFLNPNLYTDVDGKYRGTDLQIHEAKNFTNYTVFSLWDTYRATHPLFTLVQAERTNDFINTFLAQYQQGGKLPMWEFAGNYTGCMIGYHAVPVIADAYIKGINEFDEKLALEAMTHSANIMHLGIDAYKELGFIPIDREHESVSKTMEYAYDDWCIAQMAQAIGNNEVYETYIKRAQYYKNLFDPQTGFMRPKMNGGWIKNFDPREVNFHYTEANSWQYSFAAPQDISGHIRLMGGDAAFDAKLDSMFSASNKTTGRHQVDITGLIGQYAHGNEPSHHIAYLYNYVGKPHKTQAIVHRIMNEMYQNNPAGLCGNEDCGQMSAWYVFSALGFYPVTPGNTMYTIGTPLFPELNLYPDKGKEFTIKANNISDKNFYIQSVQLNGKELNRSYITHDEILKGGTLEFEMGSEPNVSWAAEPDQRPKTSIDDVELTPVPSIEADSRTFFDQLKVEIQPAFDSHRVVYSLIMSDDTSEFIDYNASINITSTSEVWAKSIDENGNESFTVKAKYYKVPTDRNINIISEYDPQYNAGGDFGLIDYIRGGNNFRNGSWQGYQGTDFEAIVDLGKIQKINTAGAGFLQEIRSWIWMPTKVEVYTSIDGKNFILSGTVINDIPADSYNIFVKDYIADLKNIKARFVKIKAYNYGTLPEWHLGAGGQAYIFTDEIIIE